jgi:hypothetical protein
VRVTSRQARCPASGTKLNLSSPATNRFHSRSAPRTSVLRPFGARFDCACARCSRICASRASHTGFQYCAVDSITASATPVPNRRTCHYGSSSPASATTTTRSFLCTSIAAILFDIFDPVRRAADNAPKDKGTHPLVPLPAGMAVAHNR